MRTWQNTFSSRAARFGLVVAVLGCAVQVPPSGGPEDKTPPQIAGTVPRGDSSGVSADASVSIAFSESMRREGLVRLVAFSPAIEYGRVRWKGNTVTIEPHGGLHPDTTYVVTVRPGIRDRHNVATKTDFSFAFATSASIDTGSVSGVIRYRREPTAKGVVHAFVLPKDSSFSPESAPPDRRAMTDKNGAYRLRYMPARGNRILIWAFEDSNGDVSYDPDRENAFLYPDTIVLDPADPVRSGVNLDVVDPNEPGMIAGRITNETGIDSLMVSVTLTEMVDTIPPTYYTVCDNRGNFEFGSVLAGTYVLRGFMDIFADSLCGTYPCGEDSLGRCDEPCAIFPDTLYLKPGGEIRLKPFVLQDARPAVIRP